ncbi:DUF4817 domain-containing protein [Trichonephila clavipes]|nr:DUF4817 domain-containing protein [Trichonephila clavipes]
MITNFFIPELNNHDVQELWFQQDGATCHTARATIDLLKDTFGDHLISRFGPVNWPPRSCDLTPLDFFLWGYVKSLVYADKPQTLDHLEDNIRRVVADIRPQMLEKVIENWTSRLDYIRASRVSPMPEIIFKIYLSNACAWLLVNLTPSFPVPTDDVISRGFIESSALDQMVTIHSGMAVEWAGLVSSYAKPVQGHGSIFVKVCGDDALCSSEGQRSFRLSRLGFLLGFLVGSFFVGDPNMTWDPLDEAHFWLNGYVNKQKCRIWSEANPQVYVETPLHPEKLTVWCALWAGGILLQKRSRPQRYSQW